MQAVYLVHGQDVFTLALPFTAYELVVKYSLRTAFPFHSFRTSCGFGVHDGCAS